MAWQVAETNLKFKNEISNAKNWSLEEAETHLLKRYKRNEITKALAAMMKGDEDPLDAIAWEIVAKKGKDVVVAAEPVLSEKKQRQLAQEGLVPGQGRLPN